MVKIRAIVALCCSVGVCAQKVKLISKEGEDLYFEEDVACQSLIVAEMIESSGPDDAIPLPNVDIDTLKLMQEAMSLLKNNNKDGKSPLHINLDVLKTGDGSKNGSPFTASEATLKASNVPEVYRKFMATHFDDDDKTHQKLFNAIRAANYLDVEHLLRLFSAKLASFIQGRTPEQIVDAFKKMMVEIETEEKEKTQKIHQQKTEEKTVDVSKTKQEEETKSDIKTEQEEDWEDIKSEQEIKFEK